VSLRPDRIWCLPPGGEPILRGRGAALILPDPARPGYTLWGTAATLQAHLGLAGGWRSAFAAVHLYPEWRDGADAGAGYGAPVLDGAVDPAGPVARVAPLPYVPPVPDLALARDGAYAAIAAAIEQRKNQGWWARLDVGFAQWLAGDQAQAWAAAPQWVLFPGVPPYDRLALLGQIARAEARAAAGAADLHAYTCATAADRTAGDRPRRRYWTLEQLREIADRGGALLEALGDIRDEAEELIAGADSVSEIALLRDDALAQLATAEWPEGL
jgi:hypothetical protein